MGNRYSYVENNPLNFIDPSGQKECVDWDANGQCDVVGSPDGNDIDYIQGKRWLDNGTRRKSPTKLNRSKLTNTRGNTKMSGKDLNDWYLGIWSDFGAWYWEDDFYGGDGAFTIYEAISALSIYETGPLWGIIDAQVFEEAGLRSSNASCQYRYDKLGDDIPCTPEGFVNWAAGYIDSGQSRVPGLYLDDPRDINPDVNSPYNFSSEDMQWILSATAGWINNTGEYASGYCDTCPYGWADYTMPWINALIPFLNAHPELVFYWDGEFLIPSGCFYKAGREENGYIFDWCVPVR